MISFRFHVVSITAVFLAIAIGVVVGTTYVDGAVVDGLRNRIESVSNNLDDRKAANDRLESELSEAQEYIGLSQDYAVTDRLSDVPVLLVATRGIDEDDVERIALLARQAGGIVPGIVWMESPWGLESDEDRALLAEIVDRQATDEVADLWATAWEAIVDDLTAEVGTEGGTTQPEVLAALETAGFITVDSLEDASSSLEDLSGANPGVLVVTGARAQDELEPIVPTVVGAVVGGGLSTVVADVYVEAPEAPERGVMLAESLAQELRDAIAVVDHADLAEGQVATVLALDAAADGAIGRHYGYGDGAEGVLPAWTPP